MATQFDRKSISYYFKSLNFTRYLKNNFIKYILVGNKRSWTHWFQQGCAGLYYSDTWPNSLIFIKKQNSGNVATWQPTLTKILKEVSGLRYLRIHPHMKHQKTEIYDFVLMLKHKWFHSDHYNSVFITSSFGLRQSNFRFFAWSPDLGTIQEYLSVSSFIKPA